MRYMYTDPKLAGASIVRSFDFNPWLQSIGAAFTSYEINQAPGLNITADASRGIVNAIATSGTEGSSYRVGIICVASNGLVRQTIWEVIVAGVRAIGVRDDVGIVDNITGTGTGVAPSQRAVREAFNSLQAQIDTIEITGGVVPVVGSIATPSSTSVPSVNAVINALSGKADSTTVAALAATVASVNPAAIAAKANQSDLDALVTVVAGKASTTALNAKADAATVNTQLALKADASALAGKADSATVNTALALKADASALAMKANASDVSTALAAKANSSDVSTALGLKADHTAMSTALGLKADASALAAKADAAATATALGLKADATALTAKANVVDVATSLALKADASALAAKADATAVAISLALKADATALAAKANSADVAASLGLKADASALASKANISTVSALQAQVDALPQASFSVAVMPGLVNAVSDDTVLLAGNATGVVEVRASSLVTPKTIQLIRRGAGTTKVRVRGPSGCARLSGTANYFTMPGVNLGADYTVGICVRIDEAALTGIGGPTHLSMLPLLSSAAPFDLFLASDTFYDQYTGQTTNLQKGVGFFSQRASADGIVQAYFYATSQNAPFFPGSPFFGKFVWLFLRTTSVDVTEDTQTWAARICPAQSTSVWAGAAVPHALAGRANVDYSRNDVSWMPLKTQSGMALKVGGGQPNRGFDVFAVFKTSSALSANQMSAATTGLRPEEFGAAMGSNDFYVDCSSLESLTAANPYGGPVPTVSGSLEFRDDGPVQSRIITSVTSSAPKRAILSSAGVFAV